MEKGLLILHLGSQGAASRFGKIARFVLYVPMEDNWGSIISSFSGAIIEVCLLV